jgi:hypothetical protein
MSDMQILLERNPSPMKLEVLGVYEWPIWRKEASRFAWTYQKPETCYILRGRFTVTPDGGEPQTFQRGDLITFPEGLSCTWDIEQDVEKHYDFG